MAVEKVDIFKNSLTQKEYKNLLIGVENGFKKKNICNDGSARVYSFGKDRVVRVGSGVYDARYESSGYHPWVSKIVIPHKSRATPKIYFHGLVKYDEPICDYSYEWLEESETDLVKTQVVTVMEKLYHNCRTASILINDYNADYMKFTYDFGKVREIPQKYYSRMNRILNKAWDVGVQCEDVHDKNIMFRKNGDPVLTDPSF